VDEGPSSGLLKGKKHGAPSKGVAQRGELRSARDRGCGAGLDAERLALDERKLGANSRRGSRGNPSSGAFWGDLVVGNSLKSIVGRQKKGGERQPSSGEGPLWFKGVQAEANFSAIVRETEGLVGRNYNDNGTGRDLSPFSIKWRNPSHLLKESIRGAGETLRGKKPRTEEDGNLIEKKGRGEKDFLKTYGWRGWGSPALQFNIDRVAERAPERR